MSVTSQSASSVAGGRESRPCRNTLLQRTQRQSRSLTVEPLEPRQLLSLTTAAESSILGLPPPAVVGRHLFYNQSFWDGNDAAIEVDDDGAIAPDKDAYRPGNGLIDNSSISGYARGINGIMVDLADGAAPAAITADDFVFKTGNNNAPADWTTFPVPSAVVVRLGAGDLGSDRIEITWATGVIRDQWLEVQVLDTADTGLAAPDVHFWGNKVGDSGTATPATIFTTTSTDAIQVFASLTGAAAVDNLRDYNRSGTVTSTDAILVFANLGTITRIEIGAGGPFAPEAGEGNSDDGGAGSAVASALAARPPDSTSQPPPTAVRQELDVASAKTATVRLADEAANIVGRARVAILQGDSFVIDLALDDELLDSLLGGDSS